MFLSQLKEVMGKIKTTAVVLKANLYLLDKKERGVIDEVLESPSEEFIPREKQDAIFSFFGSMEYSLPILKKDVLLKYANLLNRGGIACIGMDLSLYQLFGESKSYPKELEPTKKETQSWKKEDWERYLLELRECEMNQIKQKMRGILRALKKRGFQAEHHYVPKNKEKEMPRDILIIRKPK